MKNTAIEAGARTASVLIHAENRPKNDKEKLELEAVLESIRAAMRNVKEGSVYQAIRKVLRAHVVAGTSTITGVHPDRRRLLASRIAMGFALEHIRSLTTAEKSAPAARTGGAL
jgi:hypothetical protein